MKKHSLLKAGAATAAIALTIAAPAATVGMARAGW
jgi:hypothetical protein